MTKSSKNIVTKKYFETNFSNRNDKVVVEESLLINVNKKPFTLTMQTPGNEKELVRGLLFTEGILCENEQFDFFITEKKNGIVTSINVEITNPRFNEQILDKRNLLSVSSCGICGKLELNAVDHSELFNNTSTLSLLSLKDMFDEMRNNQKLFEETGGSHSAAIYDINYNLISVFEDIGRHNAVDKSIGKLLLKNALENAHYLLVSGRVSYEIITKALAARIPVVAAISSVSDLSIELANEYGMTILGFCRNNEFTCYSNCEIIQK